MIDSKTKATGKRRNEDLPSAPIRVEYEVVERHEDIIPMTPFGTVSIGQYVDDLIATLGREGRSMGRITLDLAEYCKAFSLHDPGHKRVD